MECHLRSPVHHHSTQVRFLRFKHIIQLQQIQTKSVATEKINNSLLNENIHLMFNSKDGRFLLDGLRLNRLFEFEQCKFS